MISSNPVEKWLTQSDEVLSIGGWVLSRRSYGLVFGLRIPIIDSIKKSGLD